MNEKNSHPPISNSLLFEKSDEPAEEYTTKMIMAYDNHFFISE
jgi:hypothetical protein